MMTMSLGIAAMILPVVIPAAAHMPTVFVFAAVMGGPLMLELL
jgi:hypothetical protein